MSGRPKRTVAADMLRTIRAYGVDTVFGIPGTHNIELFRPLTELGFRAVTSRHEQGAAFAADGWAQASGVPGVVLTTSGPGLLNALSAAATSWAESRPMLIVSPGTPRGREGLRIGSLHETKDTVGAANAVLEWSRRVTTQEEAVESIHDAFAQFLAGRPAPVHIEVPLDLLDDESTLDPHALVARSHRAACDAPESRLIEAAELLAAAERPVVLAGGGSLGAREHLQLLIERLQAPLITSLNGKGVVSESHPLVIGSDVRIDRVQAVLNSADVMLVVGSDVGEAELWEQPLRPGGAVVRIDIDANQLITTLEPTVALQGDAAILLRELLGHIAAIGRTNAESWIDVASVRREVIASVREAHPKLACIVDEVARVLPSDAILAGDSSQVTYMTTSTLWVSERPGQLLYMPTYATLGYGLPAALGAKLAAPERTVVGLIGDGALMFSIQEFVTAVEHRLCLPIVCVDNGGYGEIRDNMRDAHMQPVSVELVQPRWADLGRALGGHGFEADFDTLSDAVEQALAYEMPSIIHVRV